MLLQYFSGGKICFRFCSSLKINQSIAILSKNEAIASSLLKSLEGREGGERGRDNFEREITF